MERVPLKIWWQTRLAARPHWMNALLFFCLFMALIYLPWDIFVKPVRVDEQVWLGIVFHGWAAKITALPHWAIYAAGAYGFWHMRTWMWPWAAVYAAQVAVAMLLWNLFHVGGTGGFAAGIASFALLAGLALALWTARPTFHALRVPLAQRYGGWAVITGASSGIGAEFAQALARDGMACVLTARRQDRLRKLAADLEQAYGVSTRVVAADLSADDGVDRLVEAVADLDVSVLVNNAGYGAAGRFDHQDIDRLRDMVLLNCVAPVVLTGKLLPRIEARGRGAVIVVGSAAGHQPIPLHGVYAATKAFDLFFGESLWGEMLGRGVDVLVLEPGATATEFQDVAGETSHPGEPAAAVVGVALNALGKQPSVMSGWGNWLRANLSRLFPRAFTALAAERAVARWTPAERR
jgi:uncharacterized protein